MNAILIRVMPVVMGLLLVGCGGGYSRVAGSVGGGELTALSVQEAGMTREACELSVLNRGRESYMCLPDALAVTKVKEFKVEMAAKKAKAEAKEAELKAELKAVLNTHDAADAQRRTDAQLKRTETLVNPSGVLVGVPVTPEEALVPLPLRVTRAQQEAAERQAAHDKVIKCLRQATTERALNDCSR